MLSLGGLDCVAFKEFGSPTRARTRDPMINSHLLYQLSYRGIESRILLRDVTLVNIDMLKK